jgi:serralysin
MARTAAITPATTPTRFPVTNALGTGWFCLWDAGGADTIKIPINAGAATIDLRAATLVEGDPGAGGFVSWMKGVSGGFTIAKGAVIENAEGGNGNDTLIGNQSGNVLKGNGGADRLQGGSGADMLWGGAGNDVFAFKALADFRSGADLSAACIDTVSDFVRGQDKLEFRSFDADPFLDGVQAVSFRFVGTDKPLVANDRYIGELRFDSKTKTLSGDCNNDGSLDFQVLMTGISSLSATDFLL